MLVILVQGFFVGGNGVFVFIGFFDGIVFKVDLFDVFMMWFDYGCDFDGVLSWENVFVFDGCKIFVVVMNSYGGYLLINIWKGMLFFLCILKFKILDGK